MTDIYEPQAEQDLQEILDSLSYDAAVELALLPPVTEIKLDKYVLPSFIEIPEPHITMSIGAGAFLDRAEVSFREVMEVLCSSARWPRPATTKEGLPVLTVWGRTEQGRPLVVLLRQLRSSRDRWEILMAAPMGPRQLEEFTAWEADR
jgi:hypothetical protein